MKSCKNLFHIEGGMSERFKPVALEIYGAKIPEEFVLDFVDQNFEGS